MEGSQSRMRAVFTDCGSIVSLLQICLGPPKAEGGRESSQTLALSTAWQIHLCTDIIKATRLPFCNALWITSPCVNHQRDYPVREGKSRANTFDCPHSKILQRNSCLTWAKAAANLLRM